MKGGISFSDQTGASIVSNGFESSPPDFETPMNFAEARKASNAVTLTARTASDVNTTADLSERILCSFLFLSFIGVSMVVFEAS